MSKALVVVESPAKAKTIEKYLGKDYQVLASYGHVRDLPARKGSVDPLHNFNMLYAPIEKNKKHIDAISKALKNSTKLLLATDPDREGEAISWHIFKLMQEKSLLKDKPVERIFFNEITKDAVKYAIAHPREISMNLVNAQQARRALDYLVGFNLSPLLWKKVQRGLSAGRVQSPALRLIVEREEEIEKFVAEEYWKITAKCKHDGKAFSAKLTHYNKEKLQQFSIQKAAQAQEIKNAILQQTEHKLTVKAVEKKERLRKPAPPFITSTLQQEASRKLGFTTRKTMMIAQQLYEGIELDSTTVGLITYMRTDSVHLAQEALDNMRKYITENYGKDFCPSNQRLYQTKSKNAQEAHEAIRPTSTELTPQKIAKNLTEDQAKLYALIWKRALASQMADAILDTVAVDLSQHPQHMFRANGLTIKFAGFLSLYEESKDDHKSDEEEDNTLPPLEVGQVVDLTELLPTQHFTEPPPRYSEATLVKALEEYDIGRPSTYASIIQTLQQRNYATLEKKRFYPTDIGRIVNKFLTEHFTKYVDYKFTAGLENTLDEISRGEQELIPVLNDFWQPFINQIENIETTVKRKDVTSEAIDSLCPKCNAQLVIRLGKRGRFIACSAYPECDYTKPLTNKDEEAPAEIVEGRLCPECEHPLQIKTGKYGRFIGCTQYPTCKFIEPLNKPIDTGVTCPKCTKGHLVEKKSRRGKVFYSCQTYPKCNYALWYKPVAKKCPKCNWPIMMLKEGKRIGRQLVCPQEDCKHSQEVD
ncbi:MAG: DNA topoisomerase I [Legionellales bacterium RIFCSPHIGHO2_12_FULL_37_14]|nr:MAG: DNA topoisomerase I [Legionellales bacterium RIFCSPHIGHO2_12_FULL_37_14]